MISISFSNVNCDVRIEEARSFKHWVSSILYNITQGLWTASQDFIVTLVFQKTRLIPPNMYVLHSAASLAGSEKFKTKSSNGSDYEPRSGFWTDCKIRILTHQKSPSSLCHFKNLRNRRLRQEIRFSFYSTDNIRSCSNMMDVLADPAPLSIVCSTTDGLLVILLL